jgi:Delta7-sterol 5-desaturase
LFINKQETYEMNPLDMDITLTSLFSVLLAEDVLRYVIGAGGVYLVVNTVLGRKLAQRKIRDKNPPKGQIKREILSSLRTALIFAIVGFAIVFGTELGLFWLYFDVADYGLPYMAASTLLMIVLHDGYFYFSHRFLHRPKVFRAAHKLHHKSNNPTPFTAYAFNFGEAVANAGFLPLLLLVMPLHPLAIFIFTNHMILRNAMGHSGFELFPARRDGRPMFDWMTTVTHHDIHHAQAGYNFGLYFTWWDRLMGTEHPTYHDQFKAAIRYKGKVSSELPLAPLA